MIFRTLPFIIKESKIISATIMATNDLPSGDNLVKSLARSVQNIKAHVGLWNSLYLAMVGLGVFLAVLGFFCQYISSQYGDRLDKTRDELMREKDRLATANSEAKQLEIARLHAKNLELEASISRRVLVSSAASNERLKAFSGTAYVLAVINDPEAERLAGQLRRVLDAAGWKFNGRAATALEQFIDGVFVRYRVIDKVGSAAGLLDEYLGACSVQSRVIASFPPGFDAPKGSLLIIVSMKPLPWLMDPTVNAIAPSHAKHALSEIQRAMKERSEALRAEWFPHPPVPDLPIP